MLPLNKSLITSDVIDLYFQEWEPDYDDYVIQSYKPSIGNHLFIKIMNVINLDKLDTTFQFSSSDLEATPFNTWFSMELSVGNSRRPFMIEGAFYSSGDVEDIEYSTSPIDLGPNQVYEVMGVFRADPTKTPWITLEAYYRPKFDYSSEWQSIPGWSA